MVMAKVYEALHGSDYLSDINIENFIQSLSRSLLNDYGIHNKIALKYSISKISLNMEVLVPLGLILHELLSNAMKYAFVGRDKGHIHIGLKNLKDDIEITLSDDGVGIPEEVKIPEPTTLGLSLVDMLLSEFNGTYTLDRTNGTSFKLRLPKSSQRN